jgi:hypothetical protein
MIEVKARPSESIPRARREKTAKKRAFDLFPHPGFQISAGFDELPQAEHKAWSGEGE